jgi:mannosyl-oligosaccharide alpha-1,2-mannosidase
MLTIAFVFVLQVLGGLLSTYHLTGNQMFLAKAEDIGQRLLPGISSSPSSIPYRLIKFINAKKYKHG